MDALLNELLTQGEPGTLEGDTHMYWHILISAIIFVLETHGEAIAKDTKNPFDDLAIQALIKALKLIKV